MTPEALRKLEHNPFKPGQAVLALDDQYTLLYKCYVAEQQGGQAIVHSEPVPAQKLTQWLAEYNAHLRVKAGGPMEFKIGQPIPESDDSLFSSTEKLPIAELRLLNPSRADLKSFLHNLYDQYVVMAEADPEVAIEQADSEVKSIPAQQKAFQLARSIANMAQNKLDLNGYTAIDRKCENLLTRELETHSLTIGSTAQGYDFAIDCLKVIDQALQASEQKIKAEINRLNMEIRQRDHSKRRTLEETMKYVALQGGVEALQSAQTKLLNPLRETRKNVLTVIGRLAVAADWYHETEKLAKAGK